jgi:hypothetical protein
MSFLHLRTRHASQRYDKNKNMKETSEITIILHKMSNTSLVISSRHSGELLLDVCPLVMIMP